MAGFIKVDRKILKWEWYQDVKVFHLFLYFLLKANHCDGRWQGNDIKRGQLLTGRLQLAKDTGLTEREIRTCLNKLKMTGEVTIKVTSKFSIITICKYDFYQSEYTESDQQKDQQIDQPSTSKRPANDQQATINNNTNNNKEGLRKEFNTMPVPENFNGLPDRTKEAAYELIFRTQRHKLSDETLIGMWEVFKKQNLTGKKWYANEAGVYSHYINWIKTQKFKEDGKSIVTNSNKFTAGANQLLERGKAKLDEIRKRNP